MPEIRTYEKAFAGGQVTPEFWGRVDDPAYQMGLALCRNFIVLPHGPIANRAGTAYVATSKLGATYKSRLIPFNYGLGQTMIIELGHLHARFYTLGGVLGGIGTPYEIVTPYDQADLFDIHYVQSGDVMTLVHPSYPPKELKRLALLNWTLTDITFGSTLGAPTISGLTGTGTTAAAAGTPATPITTTKQYMVTAVGADGVEEGLPSGPWYCTNDLTTKGNFVRLDWGAVTGANRYNVYSYDSGLFGFLGQTTSTFFIDDNIQPAADRPVPEAGNPFTGAGYYPGAVSYYEQRRAFAGSLNQPQNLWMTKSGTESNLNYSIPQRDDDSISFRIAARENNTIRHIVPLQDMILLTDSTEWRVRSVNSDALTATTFNVKPQSYIGASNVQPVIGGENLIFAASRGGHVREMGYSLNKNGYTTNDLSLRCPDLFDGLTVTDMAMSKSPYPIIWFVSSNGKLIGLTYVPEQSLAAWHQHDTDGSFESVAVVAEGNEDAVYVIVRRTISGATVRYVERFASRAFATQADAFFVDAGATYSGSPISTVTAGIAHLEGKTVAILGDGAVRPPQVVTGGQITLDQPASKLQIGLPITADAYTLPVAFQTDGMGQGRRKNVSKVWLRVVKSGAFLAGPSLTTLTETKIRTTEVFGSPPALQSREIALAVQPGWTDGGQVYIRNQDPVPLLIASMSLQVVVGGG